MLTHVPDVFACPSSAMHAAGNGRLATAPNGTKTGYSCELQVCPRQFELGYY